MISIELVYISSTEVTISLYRSFMLILKEILLFSSEIVRLDKQKDKYWSVKHWLQFNYFGLNLFFTYFSLPSDFFSTFFDIIFFINWSTRLTNDFNRFFIYWSSERKKFLFIEIFLLEIKYRFIARAAETGRLAGIDGLADALVGSSGVCLGAAELGRDETGGAINATAFGMINGRGAWETGFAVSTEDRLLGTTVSLNSSLCF